MDEWAGARLMPGYIIMYKGETEFQGNISNWESYKTLQKAQEAKHTMLSFDWVDDCVIIEVLD